MRWNGGSVTNNDENLISGFYESTCSGDNVCDIFYNKDEIITEYYIIWVNSNKSIWQSKVIKNPFSNLPQDSNNSNWYLLIPKKEDRVWLKIAP